MAFLLGIQARAEPSFDADTKAADWVAAHGIVGLRVAQAARARLGAETLDLLRLVVWGLSLLCNVVTAGRLSRKQAVGGVGVPICIKRCAHVHAPGDEIYLGDGRARIARLRIAPFADPHLRH